MENRDRQRPLPRLDGKAEATSGAFAEPLHPSLWEEPLSSDEAEEGELADELGPARGIFWWSLAAILLWGLIALAVN